MGTHSYHKRILLITLPQTEMEEVLHTLQISIQTYWQLNRALLKAIQHKKEEESIWSFKLTQQVSLTWLLLSQLPFNTTLQRSSEEEYSIKDTLQTMWAQPLQTMKQVNTSFSCFANGQIITFLIYLFFRKHVWSKFIFVSKKSVLQQDFKYEAIYLWLLYNR